MQIRTGTAKSDDLDIYYEDMGDPSDPAVLLIMGLGAQLLLWRDGFCEKLVERGLRVIRYDNRDVGLSSKLDGQRAGGSQYASMLRSFVGRPSPAVYTVEHLADDLASRSRVGASLHLDEGGHAAGGVALLLRPVAGDAVPLEHRPHIRLEIRGSRIRGRLGQGAFRGPDLVEGQGG